MNRIQPVSGSLRLHSPRCRAFCASLPVVAVLSLALMEPAFAETLPDALVRTPAIPLHGTAFEERMDYRTFTNVPKTRRDVKSPMPECTGCWCESAGLAPGLFCGPEFLCLRSGHEAADLGCPLSR